MLHFCRGIRELPDVNHSGHKLSTFWTCDNYCLSLKEERFFPWWLLWCESIILCTDGRHPLLRVVVRDVFSSYQLHIPWLYFSMHLCEQPEMRSGNPLHIHLFHLLVQAESNVYRGNPPKLLRRGHTLRLELERKRKGEPQKSFLHNTLLKGNIFKGFRVKMEKKNMSSLLSCL